MKSILRSIRVKAKVKIAPLLWLTVNKIYSQTLVAYFFAALLNPTSFFDIKHIIFYFVVLMGTLNMRDMKMRETR